MDRGGKSHVLVPFQGREAELNPIQERNKTADDIPSPLYRLQVLPRLFSPNAFGIRLKREAISNWHISGSP
jgi:hypothetical protein